MTKKAAKKKAAKKKAPKRAKKKAETPEPVPTTPIADEEEPFDVGPHNDYGPRGDSPQLPSKPVTFDQIVAQAKAEIETEQKLHELVEDLVLKILVAGEDYGISHRKGCRERLKESKGEDAFQGPGRCEDCHSKPSLWLPGAEKIAKRLGYYYGEPEVAKDIMEAAAGIDCPWVAFRVPVIHKRTGQVVGHGVGARTLLQSGGDPNTMVKMGKKSAVIDGAKTTFALSGFFAQDSGGGVPDAQETPEAPSAPAAVAQPASTAPGASAEAAPAPPETPAQVAASVPDRATPNLDKIIAAFELTGDDLQALYRLAGWKEGEVTEAHARAAITLVENSLKPYIDHYGGWPANTTPAERKEKLFKPWILAVSSGAWSSPEEPATSSPTTQEEASAPKALEVRGGAEADGVAKLKTLAAYKKAFNLDSLIQSWICRALHLPTDRPLEAAGKTLVWEMLHNDLPAWVSAHTSFTSTQFNKMTPEERKREILVPFLKTLSAAS